MLARESAVPGICIAATPVSSPQNGGSRHNGPFDLVDMGRDMKVGLRACGASQTVVPGTRHLRQRSQKPAEPCTSFLTVFHSTGVAFLCIYLVCTNTNARVYCQGKRVLYSTTNLQSITPADGLQAQDSRLQPPGRVPHLCCTNQRGSVAVWGGGLNTTGKVWHGESQPTMEQGWFRVRHNLWGLAGF